MDIEQLKLILGVINTATGDAKEVAIWFLAYKVFESVAFIIVTLGVVALIGRVVIKAKEIDNPQKVSPKMLLSIAAKQCWLYHGLPHELHKSIENWTEK